MSRLATLIVLLQLYSVSDPISTIHTYNKASLHLSLQIFLPTKNIGLWVVHFLWCLLKTPCNSDAEHIIRKLFVMYLTSILYCNNKAKCVYECYITCQMMQQTINIVTGWARQRHFHYYSYPCIPQRYIFYRIFHFNIQW